MGDEERRAHAVLVEQVSKICQNLIDRPFDVDSKADGVWIKAARPLEISHRHEHRWNGQAYHPRASYTKVNSRGRCRCGRFELSADGGCVIRSSEMFKPKARRCNDQHMICFVIIPVYNERDNGRAIHKTLCEAVTGEPSIDWEVLFVKDGSNDDTFAILVDLNRADRKVKVVRLSRN